MQRGSRARAPFVNGRPGAGSAGGAGPPGRRWRRRHAELANQPEQIRALQTERAGGVRAVAAHLLERGLDQPALEVRDGAVIAERAWKQWRCRRGRYRNGVHGNGDDRNRCATAEIADCRGPMASARAPPAQRAWRRCTKRRALVEGPLTVTEVPADRYDLVAGLTPGLSLKNCLLSSVKFFHWSGTSSSAKIAFTGQTGSHAPQSMHSSGWM